MFAGTINPPAEGYLKDPTGARRLWPVACRGMVDLAGLEVARDQLWAEAVHRFKAGRNGTSKPRSWKRWRPPSRRCGSSSMTGRTPIVEWLGDRTDVSVGEVLEHVLGIAKGRHSQSAQIRVVRILTAPVGISKAPTAGGDGDARTATGASPLP